MSEEYDIPEEVINGWMEDCYCCQACQNTPCESVMAGGMCDDFCDCEYENEF